VRERGTRSRAASACSRSVALRSHPDNGPTTAGMDFAIATEPVDPSRDRTKLCTSHSSSQPSVDRAGEARPRPSVPAPWVRRCRRIRNCGSGHYAFTNCPRSTRSPGRRRGGAAVPSELGPHALALCTPCGEAEANYDSSDRGGERNLEAHDISRQRCRAHAGRSPISRRPHFQR
jgi:hypothetical protein